MMDSARLSIFWIKTNQIKTGDLTYDLKTEVNMKIEASETKVTMVQKSLSKVILSCHPAAVEVYEIKKYLKKQFDVGMIEASFFEYGQFLSPICVIDKGNANYEYFAGFEMLQALQSKGVAKVTLAVFDIEDSELIENLAFSSICDVALHSLNKKSCLSDFYINLKLRAPLRLLDKFFGVKLFTRKYVASLTKTCERAVRNQEEQVKKVKIDISSFIDEIKGE